MLKIFEELSIKNVINSKWNSLMQQIDENSRYKIMDIFIKHYGFDCILAIPYRLSLLEFRKLMPTISILFKGDIIAELSENKSSIYMRCHVYGVDIEDVDNIKFKWYMVLHDNEYRNYNGETYKLKNVRNIINQNSEKKEVVGYKFDISIPEGLNFKKLKEIEVEITQQIGKCLISLDKKLNLVTGEIITKQMDDNEKFKPVKLNNPWEFFLAVNYGYSPIIADLSKSPHLLYTGKTQTGKTVAVVTGITNLCYQFSRKDLRLFCSMISAKKDLRIFIDMEQCDYYAYDIDTTLRLLKYLHKEMKRRNETFETSEKFCGSMYEWNKKHPERKMPMILASFDEMTLYMPLSSDDKSLKQKKQRCIDLFKTLITESASAGINILFCLQRPDKESFNPTIKAQIGTVIGFYQPNTASSLVAMDDESLCYLQQKREAIVRYDKGTELVKTLYLTNDMVLDILKHRYEKNHKRLELDNNGEIIQKINKNTQNNSKNEQKVIKIEEKSEKTTQKSRFQRQLERRRASNG